MEKINRIIGSILVIICIISCISSQFKAFSLATISLTLAIFICAVAMIQEYYYGDNQEYDSSVFWIIYSVMGVAVEIIVKYTAELEIIELSLSQSLRFNIFPITLPIFGVFFGTIGRMLFKSEPFIK